MRELQNEKCRSCQLFIKVASEEQFVTFEGWFWHQGCWGPWLAKEIAHLEEMDETRGLRPRERARLKDLKELAAKSQRQGGV